MALSTFTETKVDRLAGRNSAFRIDSTDLILLIAASKQTETIWKGYNPTYQFSPLNLSFCNGAYKNGYPSPTSVSAA